MTADTGEQVGTITTNENGCWHRTGLIKQAYTVQKKFKLQQAIFLSEEPIKINKGRFWE